MEPELEPRQDAASWLWQGPRLCHIHTDIYYTGRCAVKCGWTFVLSLTGHPRAFLEGWDVLNTTKCPLDPWARAWLTWVCLLPGWSLHSPCPCTPGWGSRQGAGETPGEDSGWQQHLTGWELAHVAPLQERQLLRAGLGVGTR